MINTKFEAYKVKRELRRSGKTFTVKRYTENEFGEKCLEPKIIGNILGLYHEQNSNIQIVNGEVTRSRTEKIPMMLCLSEDIEKLQPKVDDFITINDKDFTISGVVNIQEWSIISDISLEVVDNGK